MLPRPQVGHRECGVRACWSPLLVRLRKRPGPAAAVVRQSVRHSQAAVGEPLGGCAVHGAEGDPSRAASPTRRVRAGGAGAWGGRQRGKKSDTLPIIHPHRRSHRRSHAPRMPLRCRSNTDQPPPGRVQSRRACRHRIGGGRKFCAKGAAPSCVQSRRSGGGRAPLGRRFGGTPPPLSQSSPVARVSPGELNNAPEAAGPGRGVESERIPRVRDMGGISNIDEVE